MVERYMIRRNKDYQRVASVGALKEALLRAETSTDEIYNKPWAAKMEQSISNPNFEWRVMLRQHETGGRFTVHHIRVEKGSDFPNHFHRDTIAYVYITEGRARIHLSMIDEGKEEVFEMNVGDSVLLPPGAVHEIFAEDNKPLAYIAIAKVDDEIVDFVFP